MILSANEPIVPLQYDATAYKMYVQCRALTQIELRSIPVNWIDCHIEDLLIDEGKKQGRDRSILNNRVHLLSPPATEPSSETSNENEAMMESVEEDFKVDEMVPVKSSNINWRMTLGCSTPDVVSKTLRNTTQYFATSIESETRAYPRQHRQKRLLPLHVRRIPGRTYGDTFFSSIRSVRGYTCVQLFAASFADFLWVKCLRRESQVPGAYKDFVIEVGAPNELLTDNSKVQCGEKLRNLIAKFSLSMFFPPHITKIKT